MRNVPTPIRKQKALEWNCSTFLHKPQQILKSSSQLLIHKEFN